MVYMFCHKCGKKVEEHWDFCPACGAPVIRPVKFRKPSSALPLDNLFSSFKKQFDEINKLMSSDIHSMEKDFEVFNLRPERPEITEPKIKRNGFSVSIRSGTGQKPKVDIKTFGNIDKKTLEAEIKKNLGLESVHIPKEVTEPKRSDISKHPKEQFPKKKIPTITEEPKTDIKRLPDKIVIDIELPDVDSEDDIMVHLLPSSIELKAIGKKKMYFRIMQIPKGWTLISKTFKDGILRIEFRPNS
ncbi:MAG: zinc-ribbon domain-containing protein [Nanohaloarchaea archaeon]|nr:zinc-ribbon domain-containing protein [Candidatus Nanohaloarchaea archaeon]